MNPNIFRARVNSRRDRNARHLTQHPLGVLSLSEGEQNGSVQELWWGLGRAIPLRDVFSQAPRGKQDTVRIDVVAEERNERRV